MVIYETTNLINGRKYIGKDTKDDPNYLGSGKILKYAIEMYGKENFQKKILERCKTRVELSYLERYWISKTNAQYSDLYYNISNGGDGGDTLSAHPNLDEIRKRISIGTSKAQMGRKHSKETIERIRSGNIGVKHPPLTEEHKTAISKKLKGKSKPPRSEEHCKRLSESHRGQIPHNKDKWFRIPDDVFQNILIDKKNGLSMRLLIEKYEYGKHIINTNINKRK